MTDDPKLLQRKKIAQMGGRAVPAHKRTFYTNRQQAKDAGRKGGQKARANERAKKMRIKEMGV